MRSAILRTASVLIVQIMLVISIVMVIRGHNYPGGGFIGGLIAVSGVALYALAQRLHGNNRVHHLVWLVPLGIICLLSSAILSWFYHRPLLTAIWQNILINGEYYKIGTPLLFDFGIYFIILGSVAWFIIKFEE